MGREKADALVQERSTCAAPVTSERIAKPCAKSVLRASSVVAAVADGAGAVFSVGLEAIVTEKDLRGSFKGERSGKYGVQCKLV